MNLLICDSREKGNKKILEYFDKIGQDYIISKLDSGDYAFYKHFNALVDRKNNLLELSGNLCKTSEHERLKREIQRAKDLGYKEFIFLIAENNIKTIDDIKNWSSPHTKVKGTTLLKIMQTMKNKYGVRFIFCSKKEMGKRIIELLKD